MTARFGFAISLASVAFLVASAPGFAAPRGTSQEFDTRSWTTQNGLPDDSITCIQQTAEGFLWVGTARGVARFDGWTFVPVEISPAKHSLATNPPNITAQCLDSRNQLWFGTEEHGLFRLDTNATQRLSAIPVGLAGEKIFCLDADESGVVWIGTERGLVTFENEKFTRIFSEPVLSDPAVLALQATRSNGVWITTREGLRKYQNGVMQRGEFDPEAQQNSAPFLGVFEDRRGSLWGFGDTYLLNLSEGRRFNYFRGGGATLLRVWSICEGRRGELWIGTSGQGLFHFDGNRFRAVDVREGREHSGVRAVCLDRDGNLWVGTQRGLLQLRERSVRWFDGPGSAATTLAEDWNGRVWAGFENGGLFMGKAGSLEPASVGGTLASQNLVTALGFGGDSSLWVGTLGNGLFRAKDHRVTQYTLANGLTDNSVLAVCRTGNRIWVSTADGKIHRFIEQSSVTFDESNGLTGSGVTAMISPSDSTLFLGTERGEILRLHMGRFELLPEIPEFAGKPISALCEDLQKKLWAGSGGGGLACFARGAWKHWNTTNGLPENQVSGIEQSIMGDIWVATARGISRLPRDWDDSGASSNQPLAIQVEFPTGGGERALAGWPRSLRSRDGLLWFATEHGVVNFRPIEVKPVAPAPVVRIETIRANGQLRSDTGVPPVKIETHGRDVRATTTPLQLPASLRDVEIQFTAPSLAVPEHIFFRHKLEGFDPDWQDSSATRRARYGKLPPGDYQFRVEASDAAGRWNGKETALAFVVPMPIWRTPWAIAVQCLALIILAAGTARIVSHRRLRHQLARLEQQQAMERERTRIARDMHDKLGAKLTKISFVSERARKDLASNEDASEKLNSIAGTSRELLHSLDEIVWAVNPSNDTLEHLAAYLGQYAAEYFQNTNVECDMEMPEALPDQPLSAEVRHNVFLAFEEVLSNALKHSSASRVRIVMTHGNGEFQIRIADNGCGLENADAKTINENEPGRPSKRRGMGLRSMRERLAQIGGRCEIDGAADEGTTVTLTIALAARERKRG